MFGPTYRLFKLTILSGMTLVLYFLSRLEFLTWNWVQFKNQELESLLIAFMTGLRFDISAIAYLMAPIIIPTLFPWPRKWERQWKLTVWILYVIIHVPFFVFNLIDVEFVNFVGRRMTKEVLFLLQEGGDKVGGFFQTYAWLFIVNCFLLSLQIWLSYKIIFRDWFYRSDSLIWAEAHQSNKKNYASHAIIAMSFFVAYGVGARGGLQNKPLNLVSAHIFQVPLLNNLVLNTPFNLLKSYNDEALSREKYFSTDQEMLALLNAQQSGPSFINGKRLKQPQNVVIIMMESFGLEYMGQVNGVKGFTPFLDKLAKQSLFFRNGIANGRRSIEGVAAVMAGIPALMNEPFISSSFTANYFIGIGSILNSHRYHTSFFHGGKNGTMYFDSFMKSAGVEHYFGSQEYANMADHDGAWGIYDGPFFQFFNKKISEFPQPFFAGFFSLSSHQPYRIPDHLRNQYPEGPIEILKAISYADDSLKSFFDEAKKQAWYDNTLFVITADHTFRPYLAEFDNEPSRYRIPILFFHPHMNWPDEIDREQIVQQIDILPSILDFLDIELREKFLLGSSVFSPADKTATTYTDGQYMLFAKDYILRWPRGSEPLMYSVEDVRQLNALSAPPHRREELIRKMKASIQYFNQGMWDNRLYYPLQK